MARSRNIKPGFFKNEVLGEMPPLYRLLFIGLWTHADREGRFECRPRKIKAEVFPYDDVNIEDGLAALEESGFLVIYAVEGLQYVQIQNWGKHQNPHHKEVGSTIPAPEGHTDKVCAGYIPLSNTIRRRIYARDGRKCRACGAEHGQSIDHIIPISKGGNSTDDNLQVLCLGCNVLKGNRIPTTCNDQSKHGSCMNHARANNGASCPTDSLIPDSLNTDSLQEPLHDSLREPAKKSAKGSRLNSDWIPSDAMLAYAAEKCPRVNASSEAENFRDYWISKPGAGGVKLDWEATWRTWVRRAEQNAATRPHNSGARHATNQLSLADRAAAIHANRPCESDDWIDGTATPVHRGSPI